MKEEEEKAGEKEQKKKRPAKPFASFVIADWRLKKKKKGRR